MNWMNIGKQAASNQGGGGGQTNPVGGGEGGESEGFEGMMKNMPLLGGGQKEKPLKKDFAKQTEMWSTSQDYNQRLARNTKIA